MTESTLFDDEVPDNYDELPEDPTVAELTWPSPASRPNGTPTDVG